MTTFVGRNEAQMQRQFSIARMLPRHYQILEMTLAGHNTETISKTTGMSVRGINMLKRSPLFQSELVRRREQANETELMSLDRTAIMGKARSILEQATEKAARTVEKLMGSDDAAIQLRAAESVLDRVFGKKGEGKQGGMVVNISAEQVNLLALALQESKPENHKVPDETAIKREVVDEA